jgi:hypothetical protein
MKIHYDFTQTGGFPLDEDILNHLQESIQQVEKISTILGPLVILSSCVIAGGNVSNGIVAINGEVLPFVGGPVDEYVQIVQTAANLTYFDGPVHPSEITRQATFGSDVTPYLWADFKKSTAGLLAEIDDLNTDVAMLGAEIDALNGDVDDLQATQIIKLASGTENLGDADTNHSSVGEGTYHVIDIGKMLANANYQVLLSINSFSGSSQNDLYHNVVVKNKTTTTFTVYFRESGTTVQNISLDWTIIAL